MKQLATIGRYSLLESQQIDPATATSIIAPLFASLHSGDGGATNEARMVNYLEVLSKFPENILRPIVLRYRNGMLGDGKFVPTAAEIADKCRRLQETEARSKQEQEAIRQQIEDNKAFAERSRKKTPESRARVQAKFEEATKIIAENILEMERQAPRSGQMQKTHEAFKEQGRHALLNNLERMGG